MSQAEVQKRYNRLSPIYDALFSGILGDGRKEAIQQVNRLPAGAAILEIGIGTGLSLPYYKPEHRVTGVDISDKMIHKAEERVQQLGLANVTLLQMDAEKLAFPDGHFDAVVALYVFSTTDNPKTMIAETSRVCRRGGRIFILNHFTDHSSGMARIERSLRSVTRQIGWESYFDKDCIQHPTLRLIDSSRKNLFGYWQFLEYERI